MKGEENKVDLFLDSGAYSALTQNIKIDLQEYIKFIKENEEYINIYANLDVIGDAKATWKNQNIMEKAGLNPLPCFHYGEPIKYLEKYVKKYKYISLGGLVGGSNKELSKWFDNVFKNYICDDKGIPKVKVHGFGVTSLKLMLKFPWYSVDSTSWVVTGRMGGILIPKKISGKYDYKKNPLKITVSDKSPSTKQKEQHFKTFSPIQQKVFLSYLKEKGFKMGKSSFKKENTKTYTLKENEKWNKKKESIVETIIEPGLCNDYKLRDEINIIYFLDLEKSLPKWPWAYKSKKQKDLFS